MVVCGISSPVNQQPKLNPITQTLSSYHHSCSCRLILLTSPGVFEQAKRGIGCVCEARRACGLTSGRHGWMIPTGGHALLKLGLGRASTWETACVLFPTDGSAPATGGRRRNERKGDSLWFSPLLFSSLWLLLFIYFLALPGDRNVANLVFICLKTAVWYRICQSFRVTLAPDSTVVKCVVIKKYPSGSHYSFAKWLL